MVLPLSSAKSKNNLIGETEEGRKVAFGSMTSKLMELINEMPSGGWSIQMTSIQFTCDICQLVA